MAKVQNYFGLPRPPHDVYIFTPPTCPTRPTCPTCLTRLTRLTRLTSPIPLSPPSPPIPPTIARAARTPNPTSPKNFLFTLTLYLPYTNDTGRANKKRKISEV